VVRQGRGSWSILRSSRAAGKIAAKKMDAACAIQLIHRIEKSLLAK
jgi:hypothetical protein